MSELPDGKSRRSRKQTGCVRTGCVGFILLAIAIVLIPMAFGGYEAFFYRIEFNGNHRTLVPDELRGGARLRSERTKGYAYYELCASDVYDVSKLPVEAFHARMKARIASADGSTYDPEIHGWHISPDYKYQPPEFGCEGGPDRAAVRRLMTTGGYLFMSGFYSFGGHVLDTLPRLNRRYLVVVDHKKHRLYVMSKNWDNAR